MIKYLRWLLILFSFIYGFVVIIRNWFYDGGLLKSTTFQVPVISIGNLEVGGAGKTPMVEYLVRLFMPHRRLATLSRGYGRKTKGFLIAQLKQTDGNNSNLIENISQSTSSKSRETTNKNLPTFLMPTLSQQIGDEPAQFKRKFPQLTVAVCEKRVIGIQNLLANHDLIILDDAYQHRAVNPGLSILLFDYDKVYQPHLLLPSGNYREPFSSRWRAQIIIITKCPSYLKNHNLETLAQKIKPLPYQSLFFTSIIYKAILQFDGQPANFTIDNDTSVFLLTGIANSLPLINHLNTLTNNIIHHKYPDHYPFTIKNITKLANEFSISSAKKKVILTTEKDAQRLNELWFKKENNKVLDISIYIMPIEIAFLNKGNEEFDQLIFEYVRTYPTGNSIH